MLYGSVSKPCTPSVHIKIAGKWMFIPLKMVLIGIDPSPYSLPEGRPVDTTVTPRESEGSQGSPNESPWWR